MDDFVLADLAKTTELLLITSTTGDGEPPDNGAAFWRALSADDHPQLTDTRYAVLALGRLELRRLLRARAQAR